MNINITNLESLFEQTLASDSSQFDSAHDLFHLKRVVKTAKHLCATENAALEIVIPAAWLHDLIIVPKNDPRRKEASRLSAEAAIALLEKYSYPPKYYQDIYHAIHAHSFSAEVEPKSLEAKIIQDADRLDAVGAIGIARCLALGGQLERKLYCENDPFCDNRLSDDGTYTIDHFYQKLLKITETMQTTSGKAEAQKRKMVMQQYLSALRNEIQ